MTDQASTRRRTAAAERKRRYRERQACGLRCYPVEVSDAQIGRLITCGFLSPRDASQPDEVREAIERLIEFTLKE